MSTSDIVLDVSGLNVSFATERGRVTAVDDISFQVRRGEILSIVGESGSGKTVSLLSILGLIDRRNARIEGSVVFDGQRLLELSEREMRRIRGRAIGFISQDPMTALTPVHTIGWQIAEQIHAHNRLSARAANKRAIELLDAVGIPNPAGTVDRYPHQLSGGMRQRVVIAMALVMNPALVIADEPTTALDVTIQAQILELMADLTRRLGTSVLLITHDLGVVAENCARVIVMYAGEVVEASTTATLFDAAHHPYTEGLLGAMPRVGGDAERLATIPGTVPPPTAWPSGCRFRDRCPYAWDRCEREHPPLYQIGGGHISRCHLAEEPERRAHPHPPIAAELGAA